MGPSWGRALGPRDGSRFCQRSGRGLAESRTDGGTPLAASQKNSDLKRATRQEASWSDHPCSIHFCCSIHCLSSITTIVNVYRCGTGAYIGIGSRTNRGYLSD